MKKKLFVTILALSLAFSLISCNSVEGSKENGTDEGKNVESEEENTKSEEKVAYDDEYNIPTDVERVSDEELEAMDGPTREWYEHKYACEVAEAQSEIDVTPKESHLPYDIDYEDDLSTWGTYGETSEITGNRYESAEERWLAFGTNRCAIGNGDNFTEGRYYIDQKTQDSGETTDILVFMDMSGVEYRSYFCIGVNYVVMDGAIFYLVE